MNKKINTISLVVFLTFFLYVSIVTAPTISLVPQPYCNSARIVDISCPDVIKNRIVPTGGYLCEITAVIGRCTLKNESGTFYRYPACQLNELGNLSNVFSGIKYNKSTILSNGDKQEIYYALFNFSNLGDEHLYFDFSCNNNRVEFGIFTKNFKVISFDEFWILKSSERQNKINLWITFISLGIAILSIITTIIVAYKKQKIVIMDMDKKLLKKLKRMFSKK